MAKKDDAMMNTLLRRAIAALMLAGTALFLGACSEIKSGLPAPTAGIGIHEEGWDEPTSIAFHGKVLKDSLYNFKACVSCHAKSLTGGTSNKSCYGCHPPYPHKAGWTVPSDTLFHGMYPKSYRTTVEVACATSCHGKDYKGGSSGKSCFTCHGSFPHKAGWTGTVPASSHGGYLQGKNWNLIECAGCHGSDYQGGSSGKSCFTCHSSYPHLTFTNEGGHAIWLHKKGYPLVQCKTCHGATYDGGTLVTKSCMASGCHVDAGGTKKSPEACNTCHGQFSAVATDAITAAPPSGVKNDTTYAIGAHQKHLASGVLGRDVSCVECHTVPATVAPGGGHLDTELPAEVVFNGPLAIPAAPAIKLSPVYSTVTHRCSNTYCHGNWKATKSGAPVAYAFAYTDSVMEGSNFSPWWTGGAVEAACGTTCHGTAQSVAPKGHMPAGLQLCANCHTGVVNGAGVIVDKTKHINGKIDVFGTERPF